VWGDGNIILGGLGSDTLEGRGANDIIDGDRYLRVRISVRTNPADAASEIGSADLLQHTYQAGNTRTLQQDIFAGVIDPGNLVAVREIVTPTGADLTANGATNVDVAVFSGALADYTITSNANGSITVDHNGGIDGVDTIYNVEQLRFTDQTVNVAAVVNPTPTASLSAASLTFATRDTGTTSAAQVITVTNSGTANLVVSSVTLSGTDPTQFSQTNNCTSVAPAGTCTISVTFAPTTAGAKTANVSIASNLAGSPTLVGVSGTATTPAVPVAGITPTTLAFGTRSTGTTSAAQTITVTNTGGANLVVASAVLGGTNANQFARTTTCATVAPAGSCTISVTFTPTTAGAKSATVTITHNAAGSPTVVNLSGTGVVTTTATMPTPLAFGTKKINTTTTKTLTVTNTGTNPLTVSAVTPTGTGFTADRGTCNVAVAAGRTCKINVTFTPTTVGNFTGSVTLVSNAATQPSAALTGAGR